MRPLARDPRVLVGWPLALGYGRDGRLLLARRGRVYSHAKRASLVKGLDFFVVTEITLRHREM